MVDSNTSDGAGESGQAPASTYDRWTLGDPSSVPYGYAAGLGRGPPFSSSSSAADSSDGPAAGSASDDDDKGFYATTAINYTNGPAHMGHAYEGVTSDAIARFARLRAGEGTDGGRGGAYFVTGADEHGEKIAQTAEREGKEPIEICDKYVAGFRVLNQRALVSNDGYVRTTSARHRRTAQALWNRCAAAGDIYLDEYSGWYNVKEEAFVTASEAELCNFCDPTTGQPLKKVKEASYFFRMSGYHDRLAEHIAEHEEFIRPESHRNAILARLGGDRLRDLSVSRTTFTHGIPVPEGFEKEHVMYVWFDALANYLTGVDALGVNDPERGPDTELAKLWPADVHIIGKDILWFHTVIWPCILMSAGLPLPRTVFAHGFVNDREGKKMSKSVGNVVDPHDVLDAFHVDSFRWYLCKEAPYGGELSFSEASMRDMHNADLCDTLGNLVHRATMLAVKYCAGTVPDAPPPPAGDSAALDFEEARRAYVEKMTSYALEGGAGVAIRACRDVNGYLTREEPWKLKGDEHAAERRVIVRATLEAVYAAAHLLLPFIPVGAAAIFAKLGTPPRPLCEIDSNLRNLTAGTAVVPGSVLYERNLSEEEKELGKANASKNKQRGYEEAQRLKKERKAREIAASKKGAKDDQPEFTKMDIRVGQIKKVWLHPEADKLYCEEVDVGEESGGIREIASGLREHYTPEDLQDRKVLVVCNLKASKIVGFASQGMVLAAKAEDGATVELVAPPPGAAVGERVLVPGLAAGAPQSASQVKKRKTWDKVAKLLRTDGEGIATWDGRAVTTSAGPCTVPSAFGAPIS